MTGSVLGRRAVRTAFGASLAAAVLVLVTACSGSGASNTPPASTPASAPPSSAPAPTASAGSATPATGPVGTWGDAGDPASPSLVLAADGALAGTDGCNRLTGRWEDEGGGRIEFDDVASTRMACEGVDTWLSALDEATIDGDTMTVLGDDDVVVGTLERSA
ncbi:META domain-containing protein [Agromyces sp. NPDC058104]|uniref:META domain-containing protein n=1 Tax=Agromyces sp. NPDC058104 TaxID=3346342 RepID=UPI0036D8F529